MTKEDSKNKYGDHLPIYTGRDNLNYNPKITIINPTENYDHWD